MVRFPRTRAWLEQLLHTHDTPQRTAAAYALGVFFGFSPLLGLHTVLGLGFACFSSPNTNAVMGAVEPRAYGIASGILGTMRLLGQMLSMALILLLFSLIVGDAHLTVALHRPLLQSARVAFGLFALLCAAGVLASLKRGNVR